jgi:predicted component of type VI protein secretion system
MQSSGSYRITVRQGPVPGKVFDLVKDVLTIGRDMSNDVVINDAEVSRNHGRLTSQSGGYLIEDLASTNGTFVNGQRLIGPKLLNPGDVIGLGETIVMEYSYVADAGATVVASAPSPRMSAEPPTAPPPPAPEPAPMMAPDPAPMMAPPPPAPDPAPMMAPDPMPAPMMSQDAYSTGSSMMGSSPTPAAPPPPPPMMASSIPPSPAPASMAPAKPNNRNRNIGIACGCLVLLCLCVSAAFALYQYVYIPSTLVH